MQPTATSAARPFRRLPFEELPDLPRRPHPYATAESEMVLVDSEAFGPVSTHVASFGDPQAPPLLLVHGLMTAGYSWRYLLEPLGGGHRLIVPDLPGCGRTEPIPGGRYSGAALAGFVADLQRTLGIRGCDVVGNSLGGYVCMLGALRDPEGTGRLVAVHPPAFPLPRLRALHAALRVPGVGRGLSRIVRRDPQRWAHRNVHYHDESLKSLEEAREYGDALASEPGADAFVRYLADSLDPGEMSAFVSELGRRHEDGEAFPVPLLLVYATRDPVVPPEVGRRLHELIPEAEFRWLEESSHFAQVDSPGPLAAAIKSFLAG